MKKTIWSFGEEGSKDVIARNIRALHVLTQEIENCCANPYCKYPLSQDRESHFGAPGFGQVCDVCHSMYTSLSNMNPYLRDRPNYFKDLHEAYLKDIAAFKRKREGMG